MQVPSILEGESLKRLLQGAAYDLGVRYLGVCCGAGPHHVRALAEALGRKPSASRYSPDMSKHYIFGNTKDLRAQHLQYAGQLRHRTGAT